jgi:hypothetical protein
MMSLVTKGEAVRYTGGSAFIPVQAVQVVCSVPFHVPVAGAYRKG